ncbi:hypothetical protein XBI1_1370012 [Xenorhabdus bovienii str. Intermedium]|uniref:Uncharacterized protein n=1 Tax=Xenorhabdus bovienii str. Intermedium TaxID=1379677 RepID=A0A077QCT9_XENBV|nr:hypothetical protein XBI1_1370012 [Xenorhabdus bovienii str. Intermedium]
MLIKLQIEGKNRNSLNLRILPGCYSASLFIAVMGVEKK